MIGWSRDSPLRSVWVTLVQQRHRRSRRVNGIRAISAVVALIGGILVAGNLCFVFGAAVAFEATRAAAKVLYRSEWLWFLNHEVHRFYRRSRMATTTTNAKTPAMSSEPLWHPLTGTINGYRVEYSYRIPCRKSNTISDNDNDNDNANSHTEEPSRLETTEINRIILVDKGNHHNKQPNDDSDAADPTASVSYHRKEAVRSLAEYILRKQYEREQQNRRTESCREDNLETSDNGEEDRKRAHESILVPVSSSNRSTAASGRDGGVPYGYWMEKRLELSTWAGLIEPGIAFFGINFYLAGCFLNAVLTCPVTPDDENDDASGCLDHIKSSMVWAVIAVALLLPYCFLEARAVHALRLRSWKHGGDPLDCGPTEIERIRNALRWCLCFGRDGFAPNGSSDEMVYPASWRYYLRRETLYAPAMVCGVLLLWLAYGPETLLLACAVVHSTVQWISENAPIRKVTLERFRNDPSVLRTVQATATLVANKKGKESCCVELQYSVPSSSQGPSNDTTTGAVAVTKEVGSAELHKQCASHLPSTAVVVPIHLHPSYPLSGYPSAQLERDIANSWSLLRWKVACFVCLAWYLSVGISEIWIDLMHGYYPLFGELVWATVVILGGPALLLPGAAALRQIRHDRFLLDELYEPKGSVAVVVDGNDSIEE